MTSIRCGVMLLAVLAIACGGDGSPIGPSQNPPVVQPPPAPLWTHTGSGNAVFDMPLRVTRVEIRGVWSGDGTSNFIVRVGGQGVVNAILRELPDRSYTGSHLVSGGVTEITNSEHITSWSFTEIR